MGVKKIRTFQQVSGEQGETSTVLTFVNVAGQSVPPLIIYKGQRVQDTWRLKAPDSGRPSTSAGPVGGAVAGGDQQDIIVLADVHRENVAEEGTSMSFQVTQYNQM